MIMTLQKFSTFSKEEKIDYMKTMIIDKDELKINTWQWSLAHALDFYNRSFVMHSAELSILFDDLKNNFVNV